VYHNEPLSQRAIANSFCGASELRTKIGLHSIVRPKILLLELMGAGLTPTWIIQALARYIEFYRQQNNKARQDTTISPSRSLQSVQLGHHTQISPLTHPGVKSRKSNTREMCRHRQSGNLSCVRV
jgi:hypothetical protein